MKVSAILKGSPDQFGRYPIVIRVNEGEQRRFYTTPFRCREEDFENGQVKGNDTVNAQIRQLALRYESMAIETKKKHKDAEFFQYVSQCMRDWSKVRAYNTLRNYRAETEKLKGFRASFKLSQVTPQFLTQYSTYLYEQGNISTTVWSSFKYLRMVILKAKRERLIEENPFDIFRMAPYKDPEKQYLTKEEIQKIEDYIPVSGANRFSATWFVISCYTGLRYSDMNAFSKEKNIKNGRLVLTTIKTKETLSMPIAPKVKELLESINYQPMFISNQKFNDALKKIAEACGLPPVSVHTARHSFAVMCAEAGISPEVTAKLMGIRLLKTVAIYYRITNPRIDAEVSRLFK